GFTSSIIPEQWRWLYYINPMAGAIDGFRWATLHIQQPLHIPGIAASMTFVLLVLIGGLWYFRRTERTFADII
ncbi:MAG TPA: ABC transporter permease, partial [Bacteroidota bacterium]|nr:ABC transporter permease [Bacteroidota bacterium]